ncbi:MAG TPA: hypothetical protein VGH33_06885 [Isosphaeraceae bacterium]
MAQVTGVEFSTRRECLEAFAKTYGVYPPRGPIVEWWEGFEKWYKEVRADENLRSEGDENVTSLMIRLDKIEYDDDEEGEADLTDEDYGIDPALIRDDEPEFEPD